MSIYFFKRKAKPQKSAYDGRNGVYNCAKAQNQPMEERDSYGLLSIFCAWSEGFCQDILVGIKIGYNNGHAIYSMKRIGAFCRNTESF